MFFANEITLLRLSSRYIMTGQSPLLKIPREIRDQIYELVLLEEHVFYPYGYGPSTGEESQRTRITPQISILLVNKQVNCEGTAIL